MPLISSSTLTPDFRHWPMAVRNYEFDNSSH